VKAIEFSVNGVAQAVTLDPDTPLLYVLRNDLALYGTRFGCGLGQCGACNVLIDGRNLQSCNTPLWAVEGKRVTTIEGLGTLDAPHALQRAFIAEQAAQCGYCINGIMISAAALLAVDTDPDEAAIHSALERNLCRCGTHNRIVRAVQRAAKMLREGPP
jgi:nicotinate dehydrogenase subunit A